MAAISASGGSVMPGPVRIYTEFEQTPIIAKSAGLGAATGAAGDVNIMLCPSYGLLPAAGFEYTIIGTQTIVAFPVLTAGGLNIGLDQTDNDGVTFSHGITARNPVAFTVGTDGACYCKATFTVAVVAGADPLVIGFRKVAAHNADYTAYTDYALIGLVADGSHKILTNLNSAGIVTTDTTMDGTNATEFSLGVFVSADGVTTFQVNGAAPTVTKAFTFDTGDQIMPVVIMYQANAAQTGVCAWSKWDCGAQ